MGKKDVTNKQHIEDIVARFYDKMLQDSIVGFIFTDVAKIDLEHHLPLIVNFWSDIVFKEKTYHGNALQKHLDLSEKLALKPGHFTRWLYLFGEAVDAKHTGQNAELMKQRAEMVAKSISAAITDRKKGEMVLTLPKS